MTISIIKSTKRSIFILVILALVGCAEKAKNLPKEFDYGTTENGLYENSFFDLEISFDPNWTIQNKQQTENIAEQGKKLIVGDDSNLEAAVEASEINVAYLLTVFKHKVGAPVDFNPSFIAIAENVKNLPGISKGEDYLFHTKKLLEQAPVNYNFNKDISKEERGNHDFYIMETQLEYASKNIIQEYRTTITNGFSLSFIISYANPEQKAELYEILDNIKI